MQFFLHTLISSPLYKSRIISTLLRIDISFFFLRKCCALKGLICSEFSDERYEVYGIFYTLSITNKMQRNIICFIAVKALHVLRRFPHPSSGAQKLYIQHLVFVKLLLLLLLA